MSTIQTGTTTTTAITTTGDTTGNLILTADTGLIDASSTTGALTIPKGTTAQRPSSPVSGMQRYNTTLSTFEIYTAGAWNPLTVGSYNYTASYLIVAGGGGGGREDYSSGTGGGAGAGGLVTGTTTLSLGSV